MNVYENRKKGHEFLLTPPPPPPKKIIPSHNGMYVHWMCGGEGLKMFIVKVFVKRSGCVMEVIGPSILQIISRILRGKPERWGGMIPSKANPSPSPLFILFY